MFFFLSKTLDFFLMPLSILLLLLLFAFLTKNPVKSRRAALTAFILLFVFCNTFLVNAAFRWWEYPPRNLADIREPYDVGVVLTGGMTRLSSLKADHPGFGRHADRFLQAYLLYKAGKIRKILISGADNPWKMKLKLDDGQQAARLLARWGVAPGDIILEEFSRNTHQNAVNSAAVLQRTFPKGRVLLITSSFHLRRAVECFKKERVRVDVFPADIYGVELYPTLNDCIRPDPDVFAQVHLLWREWVGYVVYKAMGYC
ncbi:YdcF family protein [Salmonirosea aquatica]|uniref:YdcF family protein n=1 Tax=Salmonirosea aquatica TaxID=2654236 RepID=A0A7C9F836_9BACT|nr:YdcF family protein [Cytophagaceae bacterium SJW1-29]